MFYTQLLLSRRGPLAKIWMAAHWEKKLTKAQILETNIGNAVDSVLEPKDKMALRTTGHLLLGIVRIFSRKAKYLLADCNEAFIKIKMAFRPGASIDLPEDNREAAFEAITLPDVARDFESALPDFVTPMDFERQLALNQSRVDEITLKDDAPAAQTSNNWDDDFGDEDGFGSNEFGRGAEADDTDILPGASKRRRLSGDEDEFDDNASEPMMEEFGASSAADDDRFGLGDEAGANLMEEEEERESDENGFVAPASPARKQTKAAAIDAYETASDITVSTVLVQNDKERFVLGPIDAASVQGSEKHRGRRKRRLLIDERTGISGEEMKSQLIDYSDTVATLDLAPPTKKLMRLKETGGIDRLLVSPALDLVSKTLLQAFNANLVTRQRPDEAESADLGLALDEIRSIREGGGTPQRPFSPIAEYGEEQETHGGGSPRRHLFDLQIPTDGQGPPSVSPGARASSTSPGGLPTALEEEAPEQAERRKADSLRPPPSPRKERRKKEQQQREEIVEEDDEEEEDDEDAAAEEAAEGPRWGKRTNQILALVRRHISENEEDEEVAFSDLLSGHDTRKSAAQKFYSLLVLKKWRAIDVEQDEPYGDITIRSGPEINANF